MNHVMTRKIQEAYIGLRPSEKRVADYLLACEGNFEEMGIVSLCEAAGVSQPTVLRFTRGLGYRGYKEFKLALVREEIRETRMGEPERDIEALYGFPISPEDGLDVIPGKVIATSVQMMKGMLKTVSMKEYRGAVDSILAARRILVFGVEDSAAVAQSLMIKLRYLGIDCIHFDDYYLQNTSAMALGHGDLAVGISYSGRSAMTVELVKKSKKNGAMTLVITNFEGSPLAEYGDHVLCTGSGQFLYGEAIFSRVTQLSIVDMLYMGVLNSDYRKRRGYLEKNSRMAAALSCDTGENVPIL